MKATHLRSGLYVPEDVRTETWLSAAAAYAEVHDWRLISVVRKWEDLAEMLCGRMLDVGLVGLREHLLPDRIPRVEIISEHRPPPVPGQRRPHWR